MQSVEAILAGLQNQADPLAASKRGKASAVANALMKPSAGRISSPASGPTALAASSTGSSGASSSQANGAGSTITANDFLTLLVSELKNQDPTAPTDPSQYITQLVQVNSLQQLIGINQGVGALGSSGSTTQGGTATGALAPVGS